MAEGKEKLFSEFPSVSTSQWEQVIEKDLKGADYSKKLVWRSPDDLPVKPYYRAEDLDDVLETGMPGQFPFIRGNKTSNAWLIRQDIEFTNEEETAAKLLRLIDRGVLSFCLIAKEQCKSDEFFDFLSKLPLGKIELNFSGFEPIMILDVLDKLTTSGGYSYSDFKGSLGLDPLGDFVLSGRLQEEEESFDRLAELIERSARFPALRVIEIHASYFNNAGSTTVQAMAFGLGLANEYLVELTDRDLIIDDLARKIGFHFAVGPNYFFELAKFRAFRALWSRIVESYGAASNDIARAHVHAETSQWNKTIFDPHVNLLRTTTEAMSAVLGGKIGRAHV